MSDIVPVGDNTPVVQSRILSELEAVEKAGAYHIKGYSYRNIAELLEITPTKAKEYVSEYLLIVEQQVADDPFFLERIQSNTLQALAELDEISKEAWETVEVATENSLVTARIQALKLALEVSTKKAQLKNLLMGGAKDSGADTMAKMQRVESVNQILSEVLKDVVSGCPRCTELARTKLAEAFSIMKDETIDIGDN